MQDKEVQELEKALEQIWEIAQKMGLDPFPTKFEIVPATVMYEVGSYALPGRYSHWTFGKAYHRMKTMYDFGLSKIYEVVINTKKPLLPGTFVNVKITKAYDYDLEGEVVA